MNQYMREVDGECEYSDGEYWFSELDCCRYCREEREASGRAFAFADTRTSFGIYAGKYCDECWPKSGYRDATDENAMFDPLDAGECLEPEDY